MRYKVLFAFLLAFFSQSALAQWKKINDLDYTWGPFKIYNITLFTETGEYQPKARPVMLSLAYSKPVDGRDFAISIARSWSNLGIKFPEQNKVIERLRKTLPDLKSGDTIHYIGLPDKGYFIVNDKVIPEVFNQTVNEAILTIWLDPKVDLSRQLTSKKSETQAVYQVEYDPQAELEKEQKAKQIEPTLVAIQNAVTATTEYAFGTQKEVVLKQPVVGLPAKAIVEKVETAEKVEEKVETVEKAEKNTEEVQSQRVENSVKAVEKSEQNAKETSVEASAEMSQEKAIESKTEDSQKEKEQKVDPENPEVDIRPIEDPLPRNKRFS